MTSNDQNIKEKIMKNSSDLSNKAKDALEKAKEKMEGASKFAPKIDPKASLSRASNILSHSPKIAQFLVGGASGWCTGFLTTRVGRTACIIGGGSILFVGSMANAGIINVNWQKFGQTAESKMKNLQSKLPPMTSTLKTGKITPIFAAGFVGGFLIGVVS